MSLSAGENSPETSSSSHKAGYVAIVGQPNVGKSTLLNSLLGMKLAITSPKPQTTKDALLGIFNTSDHQLIFIDTPGFLKPKDAFQEWMKKAIVKSLRKDSDAVIWVVEPRPTKNEGEFASLVSKSKKPLIVVVNKMDAAPPGFEKQKRKAELQTYFSDNPDVFFLSARDKSSVTRLREAVLSRLPSSPAYFPKDQVTDRWERDFVAELIREQLFERFSEEVPHATAVIIEEFREREGKKDFIQVDLMVETPGQKAILLGKKGVGIKGLGQGARKEIERQLGRPVFLELKVKIKKNWRKDADFISKNSRFLS